MNFSPGSARQNVLYSLVEFASLPLLMLITAPVLLRALGQQQYGIWMLVNSVAATAGGLGGGFGEAATRFIAHYRGRADALGITRSFLAVLLVNSLMGALAASLVFICAPSLLNHVFKVGPALYNEALVAVRMAGVLLTIRFPMSVFVSATRACERYRPMVLITVLSRTILVLAAMVLAAHGFGLVGILISTVVVEALGCMAQAAVALRMLHFSAISGAHLLHGIREILGFGAFTWFKSALGILFTHADRLLVGALVGVGPLAIYALCSQVAQLIPSVMVAGFNFLFPRFAATAAHDGTTAREGYDRFLKLGLFLTLAMFVIFQPIGQILLRLWLHGAVPSGYSGLLTALIVGNCLLALAVVPQYAALALGRARALAILNMVVGVVSVALAYVLLRHIGLFGMGTTKIVTGTISLWALRVAHNALHPEPITPATRRQNFYQASCEDPVPLHKQMTISGWQRDKTRAGEIYIPATRSHR
jgi:O-antigen/teichoic acid export membrane protein